MGEVSNPSYTSSNGAKIGPCSSPGVSGNCFEISDDYKGDIARSYFYIATTYMDKFDCCDVAGVNGSHIKHGWKRYCESGIKMTQYLTWKDNSMTQYMKSRQTARHSLISQNGSTKSHIFNDISFQVIIHILHGLSGTF